MNLSEERHKDMAVKESKLGIFGFIQTYSPRKYFCIKIYMLMFIFKILMIGLKKILLCKNKGGTTMHHQQLFLKPFSEYYTEGR